MELFKKNLTICKKNNLSFCKYFSYERIPIHTLILPSRAIPHIFLLVWALGLRMKLLERVLPGVMGQPSLLSTDATCKKHFTKLLVLDIAREYNSDVIIIKNIWWKTVRALSGRMVNVLAWRLMLFDGLFLGIYKL